MIAAANGKGVYAQLSSIMQADEDVAAVIAVNDISAISRFHRGFKKSKKIILNAIRHYGFRPKLLNWMDKSMKEDKEVLMAGLSPQSIKFRDEVVNNKYNYNGTFCGKYGQHHALF